MRFSATFQTKKGQHLGGADFTASSSKSALKYVKELLSGLSPGSIAIITNVDGSVPPKIVRI